MRGKLQMVHAGVTTGLCSTFSLMYLFYAYIGFSGNLVPIAELDRVWPVALALPFACILLGWLSLRFYDIPVRRWLRAHHGVSS